MADDKRGRDKQARDAERRRDERDILTELERGDETEPPIDDADLGDIKSAVDDISFPAAGRDVVAAVGDRRIESAEGTYAVSDLISDTDAEVFPAAETVRVRLQRPTIAASMKRIAEAADALSSASLGTAQREAYEKTLRELNGIDADDDDEGVWFIADWIVDRIHETEKLPGSRAVRREAAKFCRKNGYQVRDDEWLGV
jgi:hypothetical protein